MKKILISLIIILAYNYCFSQGTVQNLEKYWYYKQRLQENFMVVSSTNESGTNHPAITRGYHPNWFNHIAYDEHGVQISWPVVSWGDNNAGLQHYIAVLATECRLLKDYGQVT